MTPLPRTLIVALASWALWLALIAIAAPAEPAGLVLAVFTLSFGAALGGCIWAQWNALPKHAALPWRRVANIGLGCAVFVPVVLVGHVAGSALAELLSS